MRLKLPTPVLFAYVRFSYQDFPQAGLDQMDSCAITQHRNVYYFQLPNLAEVRTVSLCTNREV